MQPVSQQLLIAVSIKMKILRPDGLAQKNSRGYMLLVQMLQKNNEIEEVTA